MDRLLSAEAIDLLADLSARRRPDRRLVFCRQSNALVELALRRYVNVPYEVSDRVWLVRVLKPLTPLWRLQVAEEAER